MFMILWLTELAHDFEVLGSIPATSEGFSREPANLKLFLCQRSQEESCLRREDAIP